jgi:hypothetical protein
MLPKEVECFHPLPCFLASVVQYEPIDRKPKPPWA